MSKLEDIRKTLPPGTMARIAKNLGVPQSKITRVIQGKYPHPEIVLALLEEAERVKEARKKLDRFEL